MEVIRREGGPYLREVTLFDVYEGKQVAQGYRSLAYAMTYRADDRTLTDEEVAEAQTRIEEALARELGVTVRSRGFAGILSGRAMNSQEGSGWRQSDLKPHG